MTQHVTTINTPDGTATINQELFQGYLKEAYEHLTAKAAADELFNEVVEAVAESTNLKKKKVSKYLKDRFAAKTQEAKELGELFQNLDDILLG